MLLSNPNNIGDFEVLLKGWVMQSYYNLWKAILGMFWLFCWFYGLYLELIKQRKVRSRVEVNIYSQYGVKINRERNVVIWTNSGIIVSVELTNFICLRSSVAFCYQIFRQQICSAYNWNYYLVVIRENLNCCLYCREIV